MRNDKLSVQSMDFADFSVSIISLAKIKNTLIRFARYLGQCLSFPSTAQRRI